MEILIFLFVLAVLGGYIWGHSGIKDDIVKESVERMSLDRAHQKMKVWG